MFAVERKVIQQMTADIEEAAYAEDFIDDISDIMEDSILGLDNDDILLDESEMADIENSMTGLMDGYIE